MRIPTRSSHRLDAKPSTGCTGASRTQAGIGLASAASLLSLLLAGSAQAANPPVGLGSASSFSVLAGSTVTNTGPTTMFADLGLYPGTSVTGAPHSLGATHINDAVALSAQNDLASGYRDAAGRPATTLASADLSGQSFTPGVYSASSSLLFSAGTVTLNAQGDANAVFIFEVGSSITTGSATRVLLTNGAQPCNVFWQVGASATLGSNSTFAGTVMALTSITAQTGATLDGRLLARNGAVSLDTNTITTSACAASAASSGAAGTPLASGTPVAGGPVSGGGSGATGSPIPGGGTPSATPTPVSTPVGSRNTTSKSRASRDRASRLARERARRLRRERARRLTRERVRRLSRERAHPATPRSPARPPTPSNRRWFTG